MLKTLTPLVAAALLAASTALYAQAPAPAPKADTGARPAGRPAYDCSKAKDPKACEERRTKLRAARDKAKSACDGKQGAERRDCMRQQLCAQAKDPGRCEARVKERIEKRKERREKQGEKK